MAKQVDLVNKRVILRDSLGNDLSVAKNFENNSIALVVNPSCGQSSFSAVYDSNQTNLVIITPSGGKRLCIHGVFVSTESSAGDAALDFAISNVPVFRLYATKETATASSSMNVKGAVGEALTLNTTTGANDLFLVVNYIEEG